MVIGSGKVGAGTAQGVEPRPPRQPADSAERVGEYRTFMSSFPTGVAVVTTLDRHGSPHGLTCTSLASVTLAPPTLMVCLNVRSGTLRAIAERDAFAVNLLHTAGQRAAEVFCSAATDRFGLVPWRPSYRAGLPWLYDDAFALAECRVAGTVRVGDHTIVLGEVVGLSNGPDAPLLYGKHRFSSWLPDADPVAAD
jgi:flavin reductase (DIM6/NTAB) family NADH-FMN oxidoreductase RutF